ASCQFRRQALGYLIGVVAQGQRTAAAAVVGITGCDVPDGGLHLDGDEPGDLVDGVNGARGIPYLPYHDGGDLDRVAVRVVDLELRGLLVADPGGTLDPDGERIHPLQARLADGPAVPAEQLHNPGSPSDNAKQAAQHEHAREEDERADHADGDRAPAGKMSS